MNLKIIQHNSPSFGAYFSEKNKDLINERFSDFSDKREDYKDSTLRKIDEFKKLPDHELEITDVKVKEEYNSDVSDYRYTTTFTISNNTLGTKTDVKLWKWFSGIQCYALLSGIINNAKEIFGDSLKEQTVDFDTDKLIDCLTNKDKDLNFNQNEKIIDMIDCNAKLSEKIERLQAFKDNRIDRKKLLDSLIYEKINEINNREENFNKDRKKELAKLVEYSREARFHSGWKG